jgi:hypothetical protein
MATFSLWKDFESVKQFAYKSKQHKEAIKKHANMNGIQKSCFQDFNLINQVVLGKRPFGDLKHVIVELHYCHNSEGRPAFPPFFWYKL